MTWRKFRNKIKNDMLTHQSPVDIDAIWANIEPEVDRINEEKKKKRRFLFFWWFLGLTIIGFLAGFLISRNNTPKVTQSNTQQTIQNNSTTSSTENNKPSNVIDLNKATNNQEATKTTTASNNTINNQEAASNKNKSVNTPKIKQRTKSTTKQATDQSYKYNNNTEQQSGRSTVYPYNPASSTQHSVISSPTITTPIQKTVTPYTIYKNTSTINQPISTTKNTANSTVKTKAETSTTNTSLPAELDVQQVQVKEINLIIPPFKPIKLPDSLSQLAKQANTDQDKKAKKAIEFFLTIHGGIGYTFKNIPFISDSTNLVDYRAKHETMLETSTQGVDIGLQLKNGLEFSTGFNRSQVTERFDYNDSITKRTPITYIDSIYLPLLGDTLMTFTSGFLQEKTTYNKRIFNKYHYYDVPINIGYHKQLNRNWSLGVRAGVMFNLALKTKGTILTKNDTFADIKADQELYYKSKIGLNYTGGLSLGRRLFGNTWFTVSPYARYSPHDITAQTYDVVHKQPLLIGGKLGLQFRF